MLRGQSLRQMVVSEGVDTFRRKMLHGLGLRSMQGRPHRDANGQQILVDPRSDSGKTYQRFRPHEISIQEIAKACIGDHWYEALRPGLINAAQVYEQAGNLLEAGTGAIMPSAFANINAFTAITGGLMEVSILEGWNNPGYIADEIAPVVETRMFEGRKVIGAARIGDLAEERLPGMPTKRVQFGERWITQPRTVENAFAVEITQEAIYLDQTGSVPEEANNLGDWLRYRKDIRCINAFIGVTNTYVYGGTSYNTYLAAGTWDNDFSNELLQESDVEEVMVKFRNMKDQETSTPVLIRPNMILLNRGKSRIARAILGDTATGYEYRGIPGSTTDPQEIRKSEPAYRGQFGLIESPLVYERCIATDGLALSAANAEKYWWTYEKGAMRYAQNYPIRTQTAAPNQLDMIDRGVVLYTKADERGIPMWYEPRKVVRCKN